MTNDMRFNVPLYSVTDAATYLHMPRPTLSTWVDGYVRGPYQGQPLVAAMDKTGRGQPRLPFIGFAEAYVLNAFRAAGVPLQRIRASLEALVNEVGPHALARENLATDGVEVLWRTAQRTGEAEPVRQLLVVPRSGQIVFEEAVRLYLKEITFDSNYAGLIRLPQYGQANVVVDPYRGYGHPIFDRAGVEVGNVVGRVRAGEPVEVTARDFGLPVKEVTAALDLTA